MIFRHWINRMSLMLRLLLIFLASCFLLFFLLVSGLQLIADKNSGKWRGSENIFADYGVYLSQRIGNPPQAANAQALSNELKLNISILSEQDVWHSLPLSEKHQVANLTSLDYEESQIEGVEVARTRRNYYVRVQFENADNKGQIYISKQREFIDFEMPFSAVLVFLLMPCVLFMSYRLTKSLFAPIKELQTASLEFAKGHLDHQVPIRRDDELGQLTQVLNSMARQIQKMLEAKRQMLLAISHELRTPLTRMKIATELLDDISQQAPLRRDIQEMENLINEILESERLNTQHKVLNVESTKLDDLLTELINELNLNFDKRIIFECQPLPPIRLDAMRIRLLFRNILINALQHSNDQVTVCVSLGTDQVSVEIEDKGVGIAPEDIPHLTQAFYRVDDARQRKTGGFGLGLYLCQLILDAHGGKLNITSELEKGTKVMFSLPLTN